MTQAQGPITTQVTKAINAQVPQHRQAAKARSTVRGLGAFAVWLAIRVWLYPEMPLWAFVVGVVVCITFVDHEWIAIKAKVVTAIVRDFVNAIAGRNGSPDA
jgi:hypothetical protein